MTEDTAPDSIIRLADLPARKPFRFDLSPDAQTRAAMAKALDVLDVRKLTFKGSLSARGKSAWVLEGALGATAVQSCVVTLAPVTTRIDISVRRLFTDAFEDTVTEEDTEMPEDDTIEPLTPEIDLLNVARESLGLALPDYPRAADAALEKATFAAPDVTPLSDDDIKPFAGLADLKAKLEKPDEE
ncbi:MAG: DUF177 domain-containing protein [Roseovarius sp.]